MRALSTFPCLVFACAAAFCLTSSAQLLPGAPASMTKRAAPDQPPTGVWLPGGHSYLGLSLAPSRLNACSSIALTCDSTQAAAQFQTGTMFGKFWGAEIAYSNASRIGRLAGDAPAQGLTFSLLGRTQLTPSIGLYGKAGTTYGRGDPAAPALGMAGRNGFGLAFGAGLSYDVTPRLSATLQWDSVDVPTTIGGRDPVRSTSMGLKYRY